MATIKQCDKCGTLENVEGLITIYRRRKCCNQHDGEYFQSIQADYDVCEKCAREIELMFVSSEEADKIIFA